MDRLSVRVAEIRRETESVKAFVLESATGDVLPPFAAGAHIDVRVVLASGQIAWRSYSLAGDPAERGPYEIGVLRTRDGGGSAYLHDRISIGDTLEVSAPSNRFPLAENAGEHVLIAGGIGITPLLSMARALARRAERFELWYLARSADTMSFVGAVDCLQGGRVMKHFTRNEAGRRLDLSRPLGRPAPGKHIYVCGPRSLVDDARRVAGELGYTQQAVHFELFNATPATDETSFEVELARSSVRFTVSPGETILEEAYKRGIFPSSDCTRGECGACLTRVLEGQPLHRDVYLTDAERAANEYMMICVSRSRSPRLALEL